MLVAHCFPLLLMSLLFLPLLERIAASFIPTFLSLKILHELPEHFFCVRTAIYDRGIPLPLCYASIKRHEVILLALEAINDIAEHRQIFQKLVIQKTLGP